MTRKQASARAKARRVLRGAEFLLILIYAQFTKSLTISTMKKLFIMRHAKSSWGDASLSDFDRPLNERGQRAAQLMGKRMRDKGLEPSLIISSPAVRASETADLVKNAAKFSCELRLDERIYEASPRSLIQVAAEIDDTHDSAMLVGHNPGIEGFIHLLTGAAHRMPTAAIAVIDLDIDSRQAISAGRGRLENLFRPKDEIT
jgi:phosphohistidine phosphatase